MLLAKEWELIRGDLEATRGEAVKRKLIISWGQSLALTFAIISSNE